MYEVINIRLIFDSEAARILRQELWPQCDFLEIIARCKFKTIKMVSQPWSVLVNIVVKWGKLFRLHFQFFCRIQKIVLAMKL